MAPKKNNRNTVKATEAARGVPKRPYAGGRTAMRLEAVRQALGQGFSSGYVAEKLAKEWKIDPRTVRGYIQAVREDRRKSFEEHARNGELLGDLITKAEALYRECVKDGSRSRSTALRTLERLAQWGGLDVRRVELTGAGGAPIQTQGLIELKGLPDEAFKALGPALGVVDEE